GTGKTAIAVHRAMYLAQQAEIGRRGILYLCFNQVLPRTVEAIARDLGGTNVVHNIEFLTFHSWCRGYLRSIGKEVNPEEDTTLLAADTRRVIQARGLKEALGDLQMKDV